MSGVYAESRVALMRERGTQRAANRPTGRRAANTARGTFSPSPSANLVGGPRCVIAVGLKGHSPLALPSARRRAPPLFPGHAPDGVPMVPHLVEILLYLGAGLLVILFAVWLTTRYIPNNHVGIVEKLWSSTGSIGEGAILALNGEAGYQADLLRGGVHFGLWRWQYRIHKARLVTVPQGKIGYVYARDGEPLQPSQTLARIVPCNNFQDARAFLGGEDG